MPWRRDERDGMGSRIPRLIGISVLCNVCESSTLRGWSAFSFLTHHHPPSYAELSPSFLAQTVRSSTKMASAPSSITAATVQSWLAQQSRRTLPDQDYQRRNAEFALRARKEVPAAAVVSEHLFLREVVPFQHFDETIDDWRPVFFEKLLPHVRQAKTLREMAEIVIPMAFDGHLGKKVEFRANMTPFCMAPMSETLRRGYASCTGSSILLANALRSVGIPARIAGVASWNRPDHGNHNWVEVWTGERWHFVDAVPVTNVVWDRTWFSDGLVQKSIPHSISGVFTPVWDDGEADSNYTVTWRTPNLILPALDRTAYYNAVTPEH
jgi:hypothetical protein